MGCHTLIVVNCTYLMTQNELSSALLFFYSATRFMTVFCKPNTSGACFAWCSTCCTSYHCLQRPCLLTSLIPTKFHQAYSCHLSFRFCFKWDVIILQVGFNICRNGIGDRGVIFQHIVYPSTCIFRGRSIFQVQFFITTLPMFAGT